MKTRLILFSTLILGALLFSCESNKSTPTQPVELDTDTLRTEAVSTFASALTETLAAVPTASPAPTEKFTATPVVLTATLETPAAADPCYDLIWIEDVTIPDGTNLKPNETFTKTWLVQNSGGCAWPPGFTFQNVGGDPMRGETFILSEAIPVGAKREISIQLAVPTDQNGLIQSSWRMADANGIFFGDTLTVNITVGNILTPTSTTSP
ncbi:MAG TPA: NBR1-Ig-like domain-containing protein [Anaerolineales bacterium]|nr:NBR1-Ig-like domain-containing protein [Anaerolineales bacterium]HMV96791.1 NBR1-Ig-like domain-containing protein [Anaerolineales bacterium]HMX20700.1 NBR1-Ig-like domain-containing protein [Anaerolineales bacterium]HMX73290.1 NBR1-Ig-like domain-containing protein [Anaerolineales bacterium]HMZ41408.1 NBR1-Ig-like domain-containing protein [Anaerolineales bacterium]